MLNEAVIDESILPIYRNDDNHNVRKSYRTCSLDDAREILRRIYEELPNGYVLVETGFFYLPEAYTAAFLHPNDLGFTLMTQRI